ncbi:MULTISPECIES: Zn-ribbon domain-containing OB-fold protein [Pseudonocardia]|uniref:ChsH2 C-terminal OB-fold domain-containing protein n=2 Tax=Pseudonocardia TaxID=1847 RepID=A0A1Y2MKP8_PSEAH|nr:MULTISPECIES: OB-fold domain-containing protein [Pseudonocardia]OSY35834.1 hypothetical protein BG845_05797 [Pseudonocardia autotrophica]TDN73128.1 hypothetical protein C8E95_2203 [Pseudonocardia autotrophica]BBG03847.1 hypothetical protein Pdca_50560 [Pseudonocardia autotrophica]GEC27354.1 hypothetical protein PSA01_43830 [Pseudonocardia saturnea]
MEHQELHEPATVSPLETYRQYARQGRLAYQYSPAAGAPVFYPRLVCPTTGSTELEWRVSSGAGVVYSTTTVADPAGAYDVSLIELEEGFRMMSRVVGVEPDEVRIGMAVQVAFDEHPDAPLAVFEARP